MLENKFFKAKLFLPGGPGLGEHLPFSKQFCPQNILIGNSLTYTNNHLDIFSKIRNFQLEGQKYIIPINYGNAYGNHMKFKDKSNLPMDKSIWLEEFLPREQYSDLLCSVTHAIFGHIRQQAMGNINLCLRRSVKVFLYRDSLIYKQLKEWGYVIYTIDDDLTEDSLKTVLPEEMALHNYSLNCKLCNKENRLRKAEMELQSLFD